MQCQQKYHPDVLSNEVIDHIRNNIIFYQRDLRSCKHLVSVCDFEKRHFYDKEGKLKRNKKDEIIYDGPRVAPRTSPLFQIFKIWQSANNIRFHNRNKEYLGITSEERRNIALFMNNNETIKLDDVKRILELNDDSRWYSDNAIKNGIKGNTTKYAIVTALSLLPQDKIEEITRFNLEKEPTGMVDAETGEVLVRFKKTYQQEPLYRLWHIIYSIKIDEERKNAVAKFLQSFGIDNNDVVQRLSDIDFRTPGYGNISAKAICRILPYMMEGIEYSEACEYVGINYTNSLSKEENEKRELMNEIPLLKKNSLRQPTVEKILNQTINVFNSINAVLHKNGERIDEVRVELARELKQSKEERHKTSEEIKALEDKNNQYRKILEKEYHLNATHKNLLRYRLWIESNMSCFYCEQPIGFTPFANEPEEEREHILPKSLHYDDSFANQVCSCRKCNSEKGERTALDYMRTTSHLQDYLNKVNRLHQAHKISGKKYTHLLTSYDDYIERKKNGRETKEDVQIWENPIDRQLRLSQYISRKAMEILSYACRDVVATSGTVTAINVNPGDILVCDCDNIAPDGSNFGIGGKPGYMAPEVVRGIEKPNVQTDKYSLAVVLFKLLFRGDPMEGEKVVKDICLTESSELRHYGKEAVFVYDPNNETNRPVRGIHDNVIKFWKIYPEYVREAFIRSFTTGVAEPNKRIIENEWQKLFIRLRSEIITCKCGRSNFSSTFKEDLKCHAKPIKTKGGWEN